MDIVAVVAFWYLLGSVWSTSVLLTGLAAYRRGLRVLPLLLAALLFPVTWTVWFVRGRAPVPHGLVAG